ncbi:hypothetical protein LEM8419_01847 [Neolewinella maritima]|uniref:Glycoamylase-like domain-containing protein n=1 Tax=Neolewinella maritima TaxID=1383882 RepID=A0ABM9B0U4_9BACT|nr:glucoamylase family protein [Neolewinella maritima]CAH1000713.1 hypothetical protein LEM8419_01847 [Neolewinella maritima]
MYSFLRYSYHTLPLLLLLLLAGQTLTAQVRPVNDLTAVGYDHHIEVRWKKDGVGNADSVRVYGATDGGAFTLRGTVSNRGFDADHRFVDFLGDFGITGRYYVQTITKGGKTGKPSRVVTATTREMSDEELLTMVQEYTLRYFTDFADPASGLARERNVPSPVTTGGTGFGVMAMIVGSERGFITREAAFKQTNKIVNFLKKAPTFKGAFSHWLDGDTGAVVPFSPKDDGGDLVETAFLMQGLLTARQYFNRHTKEETELRDKINRLWEAVDWNGYRKPGDEGVLYWHYSDNFDFQMDLPLRGFNEAQIVYILAAAAPNPAHRIPAALYHSGWADTANVTPAPYETDACFYGIPLLVGEGKGGPLFFSHYSYLGFDPRGKRDRYVNYFERNTNQTLINYRHALDNPYGHEGYGTDAWGLTASDDPLVGYLAHAPDSDFTDNGTLTPTAALSSIPYTPEQSMAALKHFYRDLGEDLWGSYGFYDAFNPREDWYADSYLAIDQGPIVDMIENYRSGMLWELFMSSPEIAPALDALGFVPDTDPTPVTSSPTMLEDFEGGTADLAWQAFDGSYGGPVLNPDRGGANASEWVGAYQKGAGTAYSLFLARSPQAFDLSTNNQFSIQVNSSVPTRLLMKLEGGGQSVERSVNLTTGGWRTYTFDFLDAACYSGLTDVILFFDPGVAGSSDTYLFDNLISRPAGECAGTPVDPTFLDDFECQRNAIYTIGSEFLEVVGNPDATAGSGNRSSKVGAFDDQPGAFNALVIDLGRPVDLAVTNQLSVDLRVPTSGTVLFKLEGEAPDGEPLAPVEFSREVSITDTWQRYTVDVSSAAGVGYTRLVLFFGAGQDNATVDTYLFDNLRFTQPVYQDECVIDLETTEGTPVSGAYFANGSFDGTGLVVVANPAKNAVNSSDNVGVFQEAAEGAQPFAGLGLVLNKPVTVSADDKTATLDVWMPQAGTVVLKLEGGDRAPTATGDIAASYTTPGTWQRLTFDLRPAVVDIQYRRVTLILNSTAVPTTDQVSYFDNLAVGSSSCGAASAARLAPAAARPEVVAVEALRVYPNPIGRELVIESPIEAVRFTLVNMLGQPIQELKVEQAGAKIRWELESLKGGVYLLIARDGADQMVGRATVTKR